MSKKERIALCRYISFINEEFYSYYDLHTGVRKHRVINDKLFSYIMMNSSYVIDYPVLKSPDPIDIMYKKIFNVSIPEGTYNKLIALEQLYFHLNDLLF